VSTFAIRRQLPPAVTDNPRDYLLCGGPGIESWQASVWTAADRELVCLVGAEQRPEVQGAEVEEVIEVNPGEFLPIVRELDPELEADPVAQQRGKLVVIRRNVEGWTEDDLRSAALRAMMCSFEYPELTWVRTYWSAESGRTLCLFKTKDHEQAREHSARSRIPCDEVLDAVEYTPRDVLSAVSPTEEPR
jgi:hypothetical protein